MPLSKQTRAPSLHIGAESGRGGRGEGDGGGGGGRRVASLTLSLPGLGRVRCLESETAARVLSGAERPRLLRAALFFSIAMLPMLNSVKLTSLSLVSMPVGPEMTTVRR